MNINAKMMIQKEDVYDLMKTKSKRLEKLFFRIFLFVSVLGIAAFIIGFLLHLDFTFFMAAAFLLFIPIIYIGLNRGMHKLLSGLNYKLVKRSVQEQDFTFTDTSMHVVQAMGEANIKYEELEFVMESERNLFFFINKIQSYVLNKDLLSKEELEDLKSILHQLLDKKQNRLLS
jgi:hypothetical protein